jgi:hypothetical protein
MPDYAFWARPGVSESGNPPQLIDLSDGERVPEHAGHWDM